VMELLGVPVATGLTYKPGPEEGKTTGTDPAFALLLAFMLGEQPRLTFLPVAGGQETGLGKEGELAAEPLLFQYPTLPGGGNREVAVGTTTELPCSLTPGEGEGESIPRAVPLEAEESETGKPAAGNGRELSLPLRGQEGFPASLTTGDSSPPEPGADAEGVSTGRPGQMGDYPLAGEMTAEKGEVGQTKGEGIKSRYSAPEITSSHLFTTTADSEFRPVPVQESLPSLPEAPPLDVAEPDFMEKLVARVELARERGETQLNIQLKPEVLGKVQVEFVYRKGTVSTRLMVENHEVRELLASHLPVLQETLSQQGLQLDNVAVDVFVNHQGAGDTGSQDNPWVYRQGARVPPEEGRGSTGNELTGLGPSLVREGFDYLV
jgi:hypothetical protein